ncbi:type II secretion system protein [Sulfurimonas sp.]|uniref:type II secretion system protein n=1 Tax=Sulfurimonas sp. TaxID=2022749 RepID=UPI0039E2FD1E
MRTSKYAFTMIELVFVIVVLGILAAVAIPKLSGFTDDANQARGMATISSIRSGIINERQSNLIKGITAFPAFLDDTTTYNTIDLELFDGNGTGTDDIQILQYPVYSKSESGGWMKTAANRYNFYMSKTTTVQFDYNTTTGRFDCDYSDSNCKLLTR